MPTIIKPNVTLLFTWGSEEFIAAMSDVLYRGYTFEEALKRVRSDPSLIEKRLTQLLRDGHHNVFEFIGASWLVEGSRALTHELVRHRIASYWQESQRYVDYARNPPRFILPPSIANSLTPFLDRLSEGYNAVRGIALPEDARYILPNATASRIWVLMNGREFFLTFMPLRTGLGAFHELRLIAWLMFNTLIEAYPITARWVWGHLPRLHPDYCRHVLHLSKARRRELEAKYGTGDCRVLSVRSAFDAWGLQIPESLRGLVEGV
jgi:thymidylate synthase (FAD)